MKKEISVETVAKRMGRILTTYQEQVRENEETTSEQSTSTPTFGQITYSTERGLEVQKKLLNFAAEEDSESDSDSNSDSSDQSYSLIESPPAHRLRSTKTTKSRAVKRTAMKITTAPIKRKQRKIASSKATSTITTATLKASTVEVTDSDEPDSNRLFKKTTSKKATPIIATGNCNENDNRQMTK